MTEIKPKNTNIAITHPPLLFITPFNKQPCAQQRQYEGGHTTQADKPKGIDIKFFHTSKYDTCKYQLRQIYSELTAFQ